MQRKTNVPRAFGIFSASPIITDYIYIYAECAMNHIKHPSVIAGIYLN